MSMEILGGTGPESNTSLACVSCRPTAAIPPQPYNRVASVTRLGVPDLSRTQAETQHSFKDIQDPKKIFGEKEI